MFWWRFSEISFYEYSRPPAFGTQSLHYKLLVTHCVTPCFMPVPHVGRTGTVQGTMCSQWQGSGSEAAVCLDARGAGQRLSPRREFRGRPQREGPPRVPSEGHQQRPQTVTGRKLGASRGQPPAAPCPLTEQLAGVTGPLGGPVVPPKPGLGPALGAFPWERLGSPTLGGVPRLFLWHLSPWHLLALKNTG